VWRIKPVFTKKDLQSVAVFAAATKAILEQEAALYQSYFDTLAHAER
jgi:hypothetical protein